MKKPRSWVSGCLIVCIAAFCLPYSALSQTPRGVPRAPSLFDTITVMPYITGSLNLFSGKAFPLNATGAGFGAGLTFDMTRQGQKVGFMFDFAFQEMRASAAGGS